MFNKILLCSDGSEYARNAALLGSEIARRFNSEVIALNVFDLSFASTGEMGVWAIPISQETVDICMKGQQEAAERVVKPIFEQSERPYKMLQELGHPVDGIVNVAEREQADLIVIGSRGLTGMKEFFLGSVSQGVLHHARCPVLIDRGEAQPFQRILLASDGSAGAQGAASAAFALAKRFGACLTVLNVMEPTGWFAADTNPNPVVVIEEQRDSEQRESGERERAVKESLLAVAKETEVAYELHQERGHAGQAIVRYAESGKYDLIVLGSRGLGGFERLLLGSVSHYTAHHAHCPVLVMR